MQKGNNWELSDAKLGLKIVDNFETQFEAWNSYLGEAFYDLLKTLEKKDDSFGLKKTLEQSDGECLENLWSKIQSLFSVMKRMSKDKKNTTLRDVLVSGIEEN